MPHRFDEKTGKLAANDPAFVTVPPGSGARHVKFHSNGVHHGT
ncbi:MAG: beta-propeller fold lactonase family protein [Opitutaceae bacterium]